MSPQLGLIIVQKVTRISAGRSALYRVVCGWRVGIACWVAIAIAHSFIMLATVAAEPKATSKTPYPLIGITFASVDRIVASGKLLFEVADRPDAGDVFDGWLKGSMKDLQGVERTKPTGMWFFLKPSFGVGMDQVAYTPVADTVQFLDWMASMQPGEPGSHKPVEGRTGRHAILDASGNENSLVQIQGTYAFLGDRFGGRRRRTRAAPAQDGTDAATEPAASEPAEAESDPLDLSAPLPLPDVLMRRVADRYDLSWTLLADRVPPAIKLLFSEFLKTTLEGQLQQRDDEPDNRHRVRKLAGMDAIRWIELFVNQTEELSIGSALQPDTRTGFVEVDLRSKAAGTLLKALKETAGRRSLFANLLSESAAFSLSISQTIDVQTKDMLVELAKLGGQITQESIEKSGRESDQELAAPLFRILESTANLGHADAFVQLNGTQPGDYVLRGAIRVAGGSGFAESVANILNELKSRSTSDRIKKLTVNATKIDDVSVHRFEIGELDSPSNRIYGTPINVYVAATSQAAWFTLGSEDEALKVMKSTLAKAAGPSDAGDDRMGRVPLSIIANLSKLRALADPSSEAAIPFLEAAEAAFARGSDQVKLEVRPTETGIRLRAEGGTGVISLIGKLIARNIAGEEL